AERPCTIERPAAAVQYPAKQIFANGDGGNALDGYDARVRHDAAHFIRGHQEEAITGKAHDLGFDPAAVLRNDVTTSADSRMAALRFHRQSDRTAQHAFHYHLRPGILCALHVVS